MALFSVRSYLAACLLGSALLAPALAQTVLVLPVAPAAAVDLRPALGVAPGHTLRLEHLPLGEAGSEQPSAELRRMRPSAPLLVVHAGSEVTQTRPEPRAHFTGQLAGEPDSSVFMSIDSAGAMRSIVRRGQAIFVTDLPVPGAQGNAHAIGRLAPALRSSRVDTATNAPARPFACGVDEHFIDQSYIPPSAALLQNLQSHNTRTALQSAAAPGLQRRADIIIETDYELYQRLGSSQAVYAYVADLFGYVSAQYESEAGTRLNVTQVHVYSTPADPWSASDAGDLLDQLQAYWNTPGRSNQARHHVHLLSARDANGGIAYLNTLQAGAQSHAYGVSGNIDGGFSASNPQIVWDAVVVAHEIGHAFGSDHTHNYDAPYIGSAQGGAIDCCFADASRSQCGLRNGGAGRPGTLPGIGSLQGGTSGSGAGTIMSYCHGQRPGMSNISFNFGSHHSRGVNAWRVASVLQGSAQTHLPLDNVVQKHALSVSKAGSGSGTVRSTPAGIDCASASCTAPFATGTQVTLAAQPAPGSSFAGWSGDCSAATGSCSVTLDSARSVTARFDAAPTVRLVTLSKTGSGSGSVTSTPAGLACASECAVASASFASNAAATLVAQAAAGSQFAGWSGACSTSASSCTIPAGSASASVTANFTATAPTTRRLTLSKAGSGQGSISASPIGLTCNDSCTRISALLDRKTSTTLVARAAAGSAFTGWGGVCSGTGSCSVVAGTSDVQAIAHFSSQGGGGGAIDGPVAFVTRQYQDFLRRAPDSAGLNHWVQQIESGTATRAQVIEVFLKTDEYQGRLAPIVRLYSAYFQRLPDYAGLMYWFNSMHPTNGTIGPDLRHVSNAFAQSGEFVTIYGPLDNSQFVTRVYANVLGRAPEAAGHAYWLGRLNAGLSRGELMLGFSESVENQQATASTQRDVLVYAGMLRRAPSASEHAQWLTGHSSVLDLIGSILQSPEYAARY